MAIHGAGPVPAARSSDSPPQLVARARPHTRAAWPRPPRPGVRAPPPRRGPRPPRARTGPVRPGRARLLSPARPPHAGAGRARGRGGSRRDPVQTSGRRPGWPRCPYRRCLRTRGRSLRACSSWARGSPSRAARARWIHSGQFPSRRARAGKSRSRRARAGQFPSRRARAGQVRSWWSPRCLSQGPASRGLASRGPGSAALVPRRLVATGRPDRTRWGPLRLSWLLVALSRGPPGPSRSGPGAPGAATPRAGPGSAGPPPSRASAPPVISGLTDELADTWSVTETWSRRCRPAGGTATEPPTAGGPGLVLPRDRDPPGPGRMYRRTRSKSRSRISRTPSDRVPGGQRMTKLRERHLPLPAVTGYGSRTVTE